MPVARDPRWSDPDYLRRRYLDERARIDDLARELHVTRATCRQALIDAGITIRARGVEGGLAITGLPDGPGRAEAMYRAGASLKAVGGALGVDSTTVRRFLRQRGVPIRPRGGQPGGRGRPGPAELRDRQWLHRRHVTEGASQREIARELGCGQATVSRALRAARLVRQRSGRDERA